MIILPAIDLFGGKVVKLDHKTHTQVEKDYGTPAEVATRWVEGGARELHVIDLDGAFGRRRNWRALMDIAHVAAYKGVKMIVGGGFREDADVDFFLSRGGDPEECRFVEATYEQFVKETGSKLPYPAFWSALDAIIIGTKAVTDFDWLSRTVERYPNKVIVAIDGIGRQIVVKGWQEKTGLDVVEFAAKCKDLPLRGFLYTNVDAEGKGKGVKWAPIEDICIHCSKPVIFSGGIGSVDEVVMFKSLGAMGVVLGSALYGGRIDLKSAQEAVQ
jgi:phosphoribosylformimino-5-aminoimidazole carboxamide ribotide isomerase